MEAEGDVAEGACEAVDLDVETAYIDADGFETHKEVEESVSVEREGKWLYGASAGHAHPSERIEYGDIREAVGLAATTEASVSEAGFILLYVRGGVAYAVVAGFVVHGSPEEDEPRRRRARWL